MAELRWHPLTQDWVMIASHRQARPQMPKDWCPFCPGSGKVPEHYDVYKYDNDFPALSQDPPAPDDVANDFFKTAPAYGKCEVILYSPGHTTTVPELSDDHMEKLVDLWCERFNALRQDEGIKYVFIFENRGEAVGVTMPHPHGQAYGYSYIPKKLADEIASSSEYYQQNGRCLFCDVLQEEVRDGRRILFANDSFYAYVPFFSPIAYGVHIMARRHVASLDQMNEKEICDLGEMVRACAGMYDSLFDMAFPYMMCMHNAPVNGENVDPSFHFHIEFFPPLRAADKQQFFASSETGAGAWCNPTAPEQKADELRAAYAKFLKNDIGK